MGGLALELRHLMPVAVIGMHRSGTSLVAHILHELGLDLGPEKWLEGANEANQDGYWENVKFRKLNDEMLRFFDGAWDDPPDNFDARLLLAYRPSALNVIEQCAFRKPWGWKDPRTTLTLPFWRTVVPDLSVVICYRERSQVCASLAKRDGMGEEKASDLWTRYLNAALVNTHGIADYFVNYEDLFEYAEPTVKELAEFVGLPYDAKALEVIRPELWHHR